MNFNTPKITIPLRYPDHNDVKEALDAIHCECCGDDYHECRGIKPITFEQVDDYFFESIPYAWRSKKLEDMCTADFIKFTERINKFFGAK